MACKLPKLPDPYSYSKFATHKGLCTHCERFHDIPKVKIDTSRFMVLGPNKDSQKKANLCTKCAKKWFVPVNAFNECPACYRVWLKRDLARLEKTTNVRLEKLYGKKAAPVARAFLQLKRAVKEVKNVKNN